MSPLRRIPLLALALLPITGALLSGCGDSPTTTAANTDTRPVDTGAASTATPAGEGDCAPADGSAEQRREFAAEPPMCLEVGKSYIAVVETNHGTLRINLRPDIAPRTVNSFVNLARYHYFDGTTCHRAIAGFVVQCGDPTATGRGGPGYVFADELDQIDGYSIGSVAMANAGPDTNGSQFFIITGDDGAALPPKYALFGQVDDADLGMVVMLDGLANPADGPPLEPIDILSIRIEER